jgi:hypothetical protein
MWVFLLHIFFHSFRSCVFCFTSSHLVFPLPLLFIRSKFFWVVLSFFSLKSCLKNPSYYFLNSHPVYVSKPPQLSAELVLCSKVEFIILSCLVFPYIFLKNLISVLCILLLCFCVTFKSFLPEFLFFIAERKKTRQNINSRQKIHLASLKKIKYSTTTGRTIHVF